MCTYHGVYSDNSSYHPATKFEICDHLDSETVLKKKTATNLGAFAGYSLAGDLQIRTVMQCKMAQQVPAMLIVPLATILNLRYLLHLVNQLPINTQSKFPPNPFKTKFLI